MSAAVVLFWCAVSVTGDASPLGCSDGTVSDGHCDQLNNNGDCGRWECSKNEPVIDNGSFNTFGP